MKTETINTTDSTMSDVEALEGTRSAAVDALIVGMAAMASAVVVLHSEPLAAIATMLLVVAAVAGLWCGRGLHQLRDERGHSLDLLPWRAAIPIATTSMGIGVMIGLVLLHAGV